MLSGMLVPDATAYSRQAACGHEGCKDLAVSHKAAARRLEAAEQQDARFQAHCAEASAAGAARLAEVERQIALVSDATARLRELVRSRLLQHACASWGGSFFYFGKSTR